jgi:hypothetical protein
MNLKNTCILEIHLFFRDYQKMRFDVWINRKGYIRLLCMERRYNSSQLSLVDRIRN